MEQKRAGVKLKPLTSNPRSSALRIHYHNPALEDRYASLHLWGWGGIDGEPLDLHPSGFDDFGVYFDVPRGRLRSWGHQRYRMGFRFKDRPGDHDAHWFEFDREWRRKDGFEVFTSVGDAQLHPTAAAALRPRIQAAYIRDHETIDVVFDRPVQISDRCEDFTLEPAGEILDVQAIEPGRARLKTSPLDLSRLSALAVETPQGTAHAGFYPAEVMEAYTTDAPLGSWVEAETTHFALWSPRASNVSLEVAKDPYDRLQQRLPMNKGDDGVWRLVLRGAHHGLWYTYRIEGPQGPGEAFRSHLPVNDPYGWVCARSGTSAGRTMVVDERLLPTARPLARRPSLSELVAWEVHIRDMTGGPGSGFSRGDAARRSYLGLCRSGTRGPGGITTGLDHLTEMGVNAVQILPIQEFPWPRSRYRWGYITANFLSPMGSYASDEGSDARLREVIKMVDALHARGIAVILDVVFNHTAEGDTTGPTYNLRGMDSKYFYRQSPRDFTYLNGSGCGNEVATERPMARRLIVDACRFWVERIGVDGFRFDLASLIDLTTLKAVEAALPDDILLYGEPWSAGRAFWGRGDLNAWPRWAVFDDVYRDAIKGKPEGAEGGFIQGQGDVASLLTAVSGSTLDFGTGGAWAPRPTAGLRYLTCHDNLTLHDKLKASVPGMVEAELRARVRLTAIIQLTSLGPVLLHGGVEMLRSKTYRPGHDGRVNRGAGGQGAFDANSYKAPDGINNIDWRQKLTYAPEVALHAALIKLRLSPLGTCLRRPSAPTHQSLTGYRSSDTPHAAGWGHNDDRSYGPTRLRVFVNASRHSDASFEVDFDGGAWFLICDGQRLDCERGLFEALSGRVEVILKPLAAAIFTDGLDPRADAAAVEAVMISGPDLT